MEFIIDFYKGLDMLNLIIFWGIIIVIILLLIFSMILINKNKKLKLIVEKQKNIDEEIPIIKEEIVVETDSYNQEIETIEPEKTFEKDDIIEYRNNLFEQSNDSNKIEENKKIETKIEIPNAPYQKNVLREMSLSQTSPIGINRENNNDNKNIEMIKDLDESLNEEKIEKTFIIKEHPRKEELNKIEEEVITDKKNNFDENTQLVPNELVPNFRENRNNDLNDENDILLKKENQNIEYKADNKENKYLEEVSRKLAEAEIPDEIERTNYELKQEEEAIISYKELMEKKDSIQTIDEEEAIISIEELMSRNNENKQKEEISKLYNLSEEEENDNFIKELKQFRNDL